MIECPNCHNLELPGTLFCSECGAQLFGLKYTRTHPFNMISPDADVSPKRARINENANAVKLPDTKKVEIVLLHVVDADRKISLSGKSEYTLGRISTDQPIIPDVDLTDYEAYNQGVSRLHAALKIGQRRVSISDLGSANGTRVNGQIIVPHVDYPLKNGDSIALGKMRIQIEITAP